MVGNYPDAPGPRIPYDRDGTQVYTIQQESGGQATPDQVLAQLTAPQLQVINSENASSGTAAGGLVFVFPAKRDLSGIFAVLMNSWASNWWCRVSSDTTNGIDGTWTNISASVTRRDDSSASKISMRTQISPLSLTGIKAIQLRAFSNNRAWRVVHLYGTVSVGEEPNRLEFWHPTLDQPLSQTPAWLDFGDRPRGTAATKQVRIRNLSSTMTANAVSVGLQALTDSSPISMVSRLSLSIGGSLEAPSLTIPTLGPSQTSEVVTIKQDLPADAPLSLWTQRITADAGSWA